MNRTGWIGFIGLSAGSLAAFAGLGGGTMQLPQAASLEFGTLHWPSAIGGVLVGLSLAAAAQVSWLDLPLRFMRWLIANERNFYRLGMAAACLAVILFY